MANPVSLRLHNVSIPSLDFRFLPAVLSELVVVLGVGMGVEVTRPVWCWMVCWVLNSIGAPSSSGAVCEGGSVMGEV